VQLNGQKNPKPNSSVDDSPSNQCSNFYLSINDGRNTINWSIAKVRGLRHLEITCDDGTLLFYSRGIRATGSEVIGCCPSSSSATITYTYRPFSSEVYITCTEVIQIDECDTTEGCQFPIGTACNDGNDSTENDVIVDNCECIGTPAPCASDLDHDGVCDEDDCEPNDPNLTHTIGMICNDGDSETHGDVYNSECLCKGFAIPDSIVPPDVVIDPDVVHDCNDEIDIHLSLNVKYGVNKRSKQEIPISKLEIYPLNDERKLKVVTTSEAEFYGLQADESNIQFVIKMYGENGNLLREKVENVPTERTGLITVSPKLFTYLHNWGSITQGNGPDTLHTLVPGVDIIRYFCGTTFSKVELLSFFQEFLELSPEEICKFKQLYDEIIGSGYYSSNLISWEDKFCELLERYYNEYLKSKNGGDEDCQCKVINSSTFIDHSIRGVTGSPLPDCPDVAITEREQINSETSSNTILNENSNWHVNTWALMGAAKSMYTMSHHWEGGDENSRISKNINMSTIKSSIQFSMKCFDPISAEIDTSCNCEKDVTVVGQYTSHATGRAGTDAGAFGMSGNGSVRSCMEDFAFFTRFTREGITRIEDGASIACVECASSDSTNFLTSLASAATDLEELVPGLIDTTGYDLSDLNELLDTSAQIVDVIDNLFSFPASCGDQIDSTYTLISANDNFTLTPSNDYVSYTMSSRIYSYTDFTNDEAYHELHVLSDYFLAGSLTSRGDSTCCDEKVGAYAIGTLMEFEEANLMEVNGNDASYLGLEFRIHGPLEQSNMLATGGLYQRGADNRLNRLQRDVAAVLNLLDQQLLTLAFPYECPDGCQYSVKCYFNCGYWGDCHEEEGNANNDEDLENRNLSISNQGNTINLNFIPDNEGNRIKIYPNPITGGESIRIESKSAFKNQILYIFRTDGKLIYESVLENDEHLRDLDNSVLHNGVNIFCIKDAQGNLYFDKIIKQ